MRLVRIATLALLGIVLVSTIACSSPSYESTKYTIYMGLNDKDTYTQLIPTAEAEERLGDIIVKYVDGYAMYTGVGVYKDEAGVTTSETSLIVEFYNATEEQIENIMDEVLLEFNQESVLLTREQVNLELYEGQPLP